MSKTATVTKADFNREWKSPHGMLYYHDVEFDNGDKGQYSSKSKDQTKFVVGRTAEYDTEDKGKWIKIAPVKQEFGGGGPKKNVHSINGSESMKMATKLLIAGKIEGDKEDKIEKRIWQYLERYAALGTEQGIHGCVAWKATVEETCAGLVALSAMADEAATKFDRLEAYARG